ncbi:MAG: carboxypeptidase regulatory-like domain-containing protein [Deltaproteobacteria bacterium]|nr:carboxypeptidase regulatory-like domain-containing protein [Deltaproteobacteria bacterium]
MVLASCASPGPTMGFELEGRVRDEFSREGLSGADVTFTSDTGLSTRTRTGSGGRYRMSVLSDVPFGQVRAEREGYNPAEVTVYFDGSDRVIDLDLRPR